MRSWPILRHYDDIHLPNIRQNLYVLGQAAR